MQHKTIWSVVTHSCKSVISLSGFPLWTQTLKQAVIIDLDDCKYLRAASCNTLFQVMIVNHLWFG